MRQWLLICLCLITLTVSAADDDNRSQAEALNAQVDRLLSQLQATRDSSVYYTTLRQAIEAGLACDSLESVPNGKGVVKTRFRHANNKRLAPLRQRLIDGAMYYYSHRHNSSALDFLKLYLTSSNSSLFSGRHDLYVGQVAYYAALLSYGAKDFTTADRYADIALHDADYARDAAEVKVSCMKELMTTHNDSTRYLIALLELHDKAPRNQTYFQQLVEYFSANGRQRQMEQFANDELRKDSMNKYVWALLGEVRMRKEDWMGAMSAYRRAIVLDPTFVEAVYNLGICQSAEVQKMIQQKGSAAPSDSLKTMLREAAASFERAETLDADRRQVDWATPLYQVYLALGEKDKAERLKPLLKGEKGDAGKS